MAPSSNTTTYKAIKKSLYLFIALLFFFPTIINADPTFFGGGFNVSSDYTYTGKFDAGGGEFQIPNGTVAEMDALSGVAEGDLFMVTDGDSAGDCSTGSGSTLVLCIYDAGQTDWVTAGDGTGGAGSGSLTDIEIGDVQLIGDAVYLDFDAVLFSGTTSTNEANITLDLTPSSGNATLVATEDALQVKYNTTDFKEDSDGLYLGDSPTIATTLLIGADPAEAGAIRLSNAGAIVWEKASPGTDISGIVVTSGDIVQIGASGSSGVTITPAVTLSSTLTDGTATLNSGAWSGISTLAMTGALSGPTTVSVTHTAPTLTFTDSTAGDGTANILFASGTAGADIVGTLQADIANSATTFISLDGTNEEVLFGKKIDIASLGIENVGAIADDGAISVISSGNTVTIEGVVFTGDAISSATTLAMAGALTGATTVALSHTAPDITLSDSDDTAGTGNLLFASANTQDVVGTIQVDVAGSATTYVEIDGVSETVDIIKNLVLTGDVTVGGGDIKTGAIALTIGDASTTSITFDTDGTGDAEIVLENDSIGDAEIDWSGLTASHIFESPGITLTANSTLASAAPDFTFTDTTSADGTANLSFQATGANETVLTIQVDEAGTPVTYLELDGINTDVEIKKALVTSSTSDLSAGNVTLGVVVGTIDAGGATSLEIPSGTSGTTNATGEIYLDTDGDGGDFDSPVIQISVNDATVGYIVTSAGVPTTDNFILKYDAASDLVSWELDQTAGAPTLDTVGAPEGAWPITFQDTEILTWTSEETDADPFIIEATGAFGDISIVKIEQKTGAATDGDLLHLVTADADVDHLLIDFAGSDYVTHKVVTAGTYTIDVTSDATASVSFPDPVATGSTLTVGTDLTITGLDITADGTEEVISLVDVGSAVNEVSISNSATGTGADNQVSIIPTGGDGVIGMLIDTKAGGTLTLGTADSLLAITSTTFNVAAGAVSGATTLAMTGALSGATTITASTGMYAPEFDAAGDEDLDIGSADVDDVTIITDGGTFIFDNGLTAIGEDLGATDAEWNDLFLNDAGIIQLGNDQDVLITHVADTGILLTGTTDNQIQIRDSAIYIHSQADTFLDLEADGAIRMNAPLTFVNQGELNLPSTDASPDTTGEIRHDSTVTGLATGALAWYDADEVRYIVDLDVLPADDNYVISYDATDDKFVMAAGAAATAYDDISDPDAASSITFGDTETVTWATEQNTAASFFIIDNTVADVTNNVYLLELQYSDDGQANADYLKIVDNNTDVWLTIQEQGMLSIGSNPGDTGIFNLDNGAVIAWEDGTECTITHVNDTGLLLNSTHQWQFQDSGTYINSSADGTLNFVSDTLAEITAPNLRLEVDDAAYLNIATANGGITTISQISDGTDGITIGDADDAIIIGAGGNVSIASAALDLDTSGNITNAGTIGSGAITSTGLITSSAAAPSFETSDTDTAAGTGTFTFASTGAYDVVGSIKVDVGGSATSYVEIDGVSETIDLLQSIVITDAKTLTFDESAADPDDADFVISATDGKMTWTTANGAFTEDITFDIDGTENQVIITSSTGVTTTDFGIINLATDALDVSDGNISNVGIIQADELEPDAVADGSLIVQGGQTATNTLKLQGYDVDGTAYTDTITITSANLVTMAIDTSDWDIDATGAITGVALDADGIGNAITNIENADIKASAAIDATKIADGTVTSAEFQYIADLTENLTTGLATQTVTVSTSVIPNASGGADVGSTSAEFNDLFLNDAGKIQLGDDQDVTITHVADAGILMELDDYISFGDNAVFIESDDDGYLDLDADTGIRLNSPGTTFPNAAVLTFTDESATTITHVDNVGLLINLELEIDGTLDADGVVALGDGGDNFSVASDGVDIDTSGNFTNVGTIGSGAITSTAAVGGTDLTASDDIIGQDDLQLDSDGALIELGEDQDVVITHVADTGLNLNEGFSIADDKVIAFGGDISSYDWSFGVNTGDTDSLEIQITNASNRTIKITNEGAGNVNLEVDGTGTFSGGIITTASASPYISFDDSDSASETTDTKFYVNATDTGAGTEDVDVYLQTQVASTLTTFLFADADGNLELGTTAMPVKILDDLTLHSSDEDPATVAGNIKHDLTVTGMSGGAIRWYDDASLGVRLVVDLDTDPSDDDYVVAYDADADKFYMKVDSSAGSPTWDSIGNPTGNDEIDMGAYTIELNVTDFQIGDGSAANAVIFTGAVGGQLKIGSAGVILTGDTDGALTFAGLGNGTDEDLTFNFDDVADTVGVSSSTSVAVVDFGSINLETDTIEADTAFVPTSSGGADLGSTSLEFDDVFLNDAGKIQLGDDQDVTLTHVADTGIQVELDDKIMFGDTAVYIHSDDDGYLDIEADTAIRMDGPVDMQANALDCDSNTVTLSTIAGTLSDGTASWDTSTQILTGFAAITSTSTITSSGIFDITGSGAMTLGSADVGSVAVLTTGAVTIYDAVNDGSPTFHIGSAIAESLQVTATYESGNQLLEKVTFETKTSDGDANDGEFEFKVDEALELTITDSGIVIADAGEIGSASDTNAITISSAGVVDITNTTEASAIGTAALTVDGGLGVAKDAWIGDDLVLDSDATVIDLGADQDVTITHVADVGITMASVAPDITLIDETAGDGTGNLLFSSGTASADIVATLQVDINNSPVTMLQLDGTNEEVLFGKKVDLASLGIENVGAIADDGAISVISSGSTVTIESVVFTGGAMTSVAGITSTGNIDFNGATAVEIENTAGDVTIANGGEIAVDTTQRQFAWHDGTAEIAIPAIEVIQIALDPGPWYDSDAEVWLLDLFADRFPDGIVITKWYVDANVADPDVEMDMNLMFCDAVAGAAFPGGSPTLIDVMDTTTGNSNETDMSNSDLTTGAIATGKSIYLLFDADPEGTCTQLSVKIYYYIPES